MTLMPPPNTPTVAIARELRRFGLAQGRDFRVTGHYVRGERRHTYVLLLTRHAQDVAAQRADDLEAATGRGPFPFRVSVQYFGRPRPVVTIANAGSRVRETPPCPQDTPAAQPPAEETTVASPAPQTPAQPPVDYREEFRQEQQAAALGWSTAHADAVRWAVAGELVLDADGTPRRITRPGRAGRRVAAARLVPLQNAAFLTAGEADEAGRRRIEATPDGRRALLVWDRQRPAPVERTRKQEGRALRPLLDGQEARRRAAEFEADMRRREAERAAWYAEWERRRAAEEWQERLWEAWAAVEGARYTWRKRPRGWAPTDEEAARHQLDPEVVAALRAEAAEVAAAGTAAVAAPQPAGDAGGVDLPDEPMVAAPVEDWALPEDGSVAAEPKWDGFRALAGRGDDGAPVIRSRNRTDLLPAFPDIAAALVEQLPPASLLDGELLVWSGGRFVFDRLGARLNRPPRVVALAAQREPASLMVFDVLHLDDRDLTGRPYRDRRAACEELFAAGRLRPPLNLCPSTTSADTARAWLEQWAPQYVEGLILKPTGGTYRPGRRGARGGWRKWRVRETREAAIGGVTGTVARPGLVLLGRWDATGQLRYLGRTSRLEAGQARDVAAVLRPASTGHPWQGWRFSAAWGSREALDVQLVEPDAVAEVSVDASRLPGGGWRHSVRWVRLRPDLAPGDLPLIPDDP